MFEKGKIRVFAKDSQIQKSFFAESSKPTADV